MIRLGPHPQGISLYMCKYSKTWKKYKVLTTSRQGIFNLYLKTGSSRRSNKYFTVGCWVVRKLIQDSFGSGKGMLAHTLFSPLLQWTPCTSDTMRMVCNIMVGIQQSLWIIITSFFFLRRWKQFKCSKYFHTIALTDHPIYVNGKRLQAKLTYP